MCAALFSRAISDLYLLCSQVNVSADAFGQGLRIEPMEELKVVNAPRKAHRALGSGHHVVALATTTIGSVLRRCKSSRRSVEVGHRANGNGSVGGWEWQDSVPRNKRWAG